MLEITENMLQVAAYDIGSQSSSPLNRSKPVSKASSANGDKNQPDKNFIAKFNKLHLQKMKESSSHNRITSHSQNQKKNHYHSQVELCGLSTPSQQNQLNQSGQTSREQPHLGK